MCLNWFSKILFPRAPDTPVNPDLSVDFLVRKGVRLLRFKLLCGLHNMFSNLFTFCGLEEIPVLQIVTQVSLELSTDLDPSPSDKYFPSLLVDDFKYCRLRFSDKAGDPTQMKWGWCQVRTRPSNTPPCIPYWVWICVNVVEAAAPEPPPSCCRRTRLLRASKINEWDALETAGQTFLSIVPF